MAASAMIDRLIHHSEILSYNVEYARSHGHTAPVVHGLQVLACTAPGATL